MNKIKPQYWLLLILIVATVLRFNRITQPFVDSFSWREVSTAMMAENFYRNNWNIFYPEVSWDGPGPSYNGREFQTVSYIVALLYVVLGQQDWIGRAVPALFGIWGIFALYKLVSHVWDEKRAIAAAAIMAILPGSIFIDRSFLPDPVMVSLVVTGFWLFVVYLKTERSRDLWLAALITTWGVLTKIPGLLVGIPILYTLFVIRGSKPIFHRRKLLPIILAMVLSLITIAAYYLWARHLALSYPPYHFAGSSNWVWKQGFSRWISQFYFLDALEQHVRDWFWTLPVTFLVILGLVLPPKLAPALEPTSTAEPAPWIFHLWLLSGLLYYLIGAKELVDNPWNFHILNPAAAALAAHGLISLGGMWVKSHKAWVSTGLMICFFLGMGWLGQHSLKDSYRAYGQKSYELGKTLASLSRPDDLVITMTDTIGEPSAVYYSHRRGWIFPPQYRPLPDDVDGMIQTFESLREQGADWFGITDKSLALLNQQYPEFVEYLSEHCTLVSQEPSWVIYQIPAPNLTPNKNTPS